LDILDRALGAEVDEFADNRDSLIVGEMHVGFIVKGFPIQVLLGLVRSLVYNDSSNAHEKRRSKRRSA
jgi:hypothetical protein